MCAARWIWENLRVYGMADASVSVACQQYFAARENCYLQLSAFVFLLRCGYFCCILLQTKSGISSEIGQRSARDGCLFNITTHSAKVILCKGAMLINWMLSESSLAQSIVVKLCQQLHRWRYSFLPNVLRF